MKKLALLFALILMGATLSAQQPNYEISTKRIGAFKLLMNYEEASAVAHKPLLKGDSSNNYQGKTTCKVDGELVDVYLGDYFDEKANQSLQKIVRLNTKSTKFKTRSGMGVGNTKYQLLDTYKDFAHFGVSPMYDDSGNRLKTTNFFILTDEEGTNISFKMVNNVVVEVEVSPAYDEGC